MKNESNYANCRKWNYAHKLDEIIRNPDNHTYRELCKLKSQIYSDKNLEEDINVLERKIEQIESLFSDKKIDSLFAIVLALIVILSTGQALLKPWMCMVVGGCALALALAIFIKY